MRKLILALAVLCSCNAVERKYSVSTTDENGFHTTYYTDTVTYRNGCVTFIDHMRGEKPITACGSVFVNEMP